MRKKFSPYPLKIDRFLSKLYSPKQPGAVVLVAKAGQVFFRKAYGMANLELRVPLAPDMVFRIGSITKQFTAIAVLMLMEKERLSLDDPIEKFLSGLPSKMRRITIKHLLTHSSGIAENIIDETNYSFFMTKDVTVQEMIDLIKERPLIFRPGEKWSYSNSGYILLGAVIEKVSDMTYAQFIQQNIFDTLQMRRSYYDNPFRITAGRANGYEQNSEGVFNAAYLSMTQPYAAGALASTIDDLLIWDKALYTEQLVKHKTLREAYTPYRLKDGTLTAYGYGWFISDYKGQRFIEHGGGINGFTVQVLRIPEETIFIAVLTNCTGPNLPSIEIVALKIAGIVLDRPYREPKAISLDENILSSYTGVYRMNSSEERYITCDNGSLYSQRSHWHRFLILPISDEEFFFADTSTTRLRFVKGKGGRIIALELRPRLGCIERCVKVKAGRKTHSKMSRV